MLRSKFTSMRPPAEIRVTRADYGSRTRLNLRTKKVLAHASSVSKFRAGGGSRTHQYLVTSEELSHESSTSIAYPQGIEPCKYSVNSRAAAPDSLGHIMVIGILEVATISNNKNTCGITKSALYRS